MADIASTIMQDTKYLPMFRPDKTCITDITSLEIFEHFKIVVGGGGTSLINFNPPPPTKVPSTTFFEILEGGV